MVASCQWWRLPEGTYPFVLRDPLHSSWRASPRATSFSWALSSAIFLGTIEAANPRLSPSEITEGLRSDLKEVWRCLSGSSQTSVFSVRRLWRLNNIDCGHMQLYGLELLWMTIQAVCNATAKPSMWIPHRQPAGDQLLWPQAWVNPGQHQPTREAVETRRWGLWHP